MTNEELLRKRVAKLEVQIWTLTGSWIPAASAAEVARQYGIDQRLPRRWKRELTETAPILATVQITSIRGVHRTAPAQLLQSVTASTALTPKASAPV